MISPKIIPFLILLASLFQIVPILSSLVVTPLDINVVIPDSLNQISLMASNANLNIISYPGFVLLNDIGDSS